MPPSIIAQKKPAHRIALALQGGGAFGAFQAGVLEALHDAGVEIDACSGSSIGAINAALYFGNEPSRRIERLKTFWNSVSVPGSALREHALQLWPPRGALEHRTVRRMLAEADQTYALQFGLPGFFVRRVDSGALADGKCLNKRGVPRNARVRTSCCKRRASGTVAPRLSGVVRFY